MGSYEIIEHTADIGIRASGADLAELLEQTALALADIEGARAAGPGEPAVVSVQAPDPGALLVDWLNELIYLFEVRGLLASVVVRSASEQAAEAEVTLVPGRPGGLAVKAATYHRLSVARSGQGWVTEVYLDV